VITQGDLFKEKKTIDEDQTRPKELLKSILKTFDQIYSSQVVREAFGEWEIEEEIEQDMKKQAEVEDF
jgi:hypothetical protein